MSKYLWIAIGLVASISRFASAAEPEANFKTSINPSAFFQTYEGGWYANSNASSEGGKGMLKVRFSVKSTDAEGIKFQVIAGCEYYTSPQKSLTSDVYSEINGSILLAESTGALFLICDGSKIPAGHVTEDSIELSLPTNCPDNGQRSTIVLKTTPQGPQVHFQSQNFDRQTVYGDALLTKLPY